MSNFRELLSDELKKRRPNLAPSSLKTYVSILFNIQKNLNNNNEVLDWFNNDHEILPHLEIKPPPSRKTVLAALFVLTGNDKYYNQMISDCKYTNEIYKDQNKLKSKRMHGCQSAK